MSVSSTDIAKATAIVVTIDRAHLERFRPEAEKWGGGWKAGVQLLTGLPTMQYMMMVAYTRKRIKHRAPLLLLAQDLDNLRFSAVAACRKLDDVQCLWITLLDGEARAIVEREALRDANIGGRA